LFFSLFADRFAIFPTGKKQARIVADNPEKDKLIEALLQERDEMYVELSRLRKNDNGALAEAEATIKELRDENKKLIDQLAWYRRKFWKSSTEKYIPEDPAQRKIDFDGLDVLPEEKGIIEKAAKEIISYERKKPEKKIKPVRQPLPEHLRREIEVIEPEGIDENWERIGQEVSEILEYEPGEFYVRQIVRPIYALKKELQQSEDASGEEQNLKNVKTATLPMLPLPRSNAGASLLAELLQGKYMHHLPFHRQIEMLKHAGVSLPASTVNGWFTASSDLLRAMYYRLRELVLSSDYIQVDESTVPVIDNSTISRPGRRGW
jgi:transposase